MEEPVLLSGYRRLWNRKWSWLSSWTTHDTIGNWRMAMCVNDIACAGGEPLFFLDYIACGKNYPEKIADIVKGVAEGCFTVWRQRWSAVRLQNIQDWCRKRIMTLAGFAVGVCDKKGNDHRWKLAKEMFLSVWLPPVYIPMDFLWCARYLRMKWTKKV